MLVDLAASVRGLLQVAGLCWLTRWRQAFRANITQDALQYAEGNGVRSRGWPAPAVRRRGNWPWPIAAALLAGRSAREQDESPRAKTLPLKRLTRPSTFADDKFRGAAA